MQHIVSLPAWSDAPELVKDGVLHVSIHVPALGATTEFLAMRLPTMFQSTLPRGERLTTTQTIYLRYLFQSTLPRGERPRICGVLCRPHDVSIHAPAWGATSTLSASSGASGGFNPRSRVGSDHTTCKLTKYGRCFNPRSRVGSDFSCIVTLSR